MGARRWAFSDGFDRFRKGLSLFGALFLAVLFWWLSIEPSNDRQWLPDVARLPTAEVDGDLITIQNVRNFVYRSEFDYDERWEERTYDLSKLVGVDVFLVYWGSPWIAHTILSWVFEDGPPLAISIETRKEVGEEYSAVRGLLPPVRDLLRGLRRIGRGPLADQPPGRRRLPLPSAGLP